jgi:aryl-alcohol dehydrogenase-like predicted oxidoreductase
MFDAYLDAGGNFIDTADLYTNGTSEEWIGRFVAARGARDRVVIATKFGFNAQPGNPNSGGAGRKNMLRAVEGSLKRLGTDYLDLVQLHSCSLETLKRGAVITALERARERGWTRYIGYSGDGAAARYAIECGRFDTLQTSVSIADQEAIDLTLPLARERRMGVIAKRPIANVAWRYTRRPESYYADYWQRLRALDYAFLRDEESAVATALRFTLTVPGVHTAIVGTTRPERWQENAALLAGGPLPRAEFERIRARWREVADASWEGQT